MLKKIKCIEKKGIFAYIDIIINLIMAKKAIGKAIGKESGKEKKKVIKKKKKEYSDEYLKYKSYIRSEEWKKVQEWFYTNIYKKRCYCCGREEGEDNCTIALHHSTYNFLYHEIEHPECLIPLCNKCHFSIHRQRSNFKRFAMNKDGENKNGGNKGEKKDEKNDEKKIKKVKKIIKKD